MLGNIQLCKLNGNYYGTCLTVYPKLNPFLKALSVNPNSWIEFSEYCPRAPEWICRISGLFLHFSQKNHITLFKGGLISEQISPCSFPQKMCQITLLLKIWGFFFEEKTKVKNILRLRHLYLARVYFWQITFFSNKHTAAQ